MLAVGADFRVRAETTTSNSTDTGKATSTVARSKGCPAISQPIVRMVPPTMEAMPPHLVTFSGQTTQASREGVMPAPTMVEAQYWMAKMLGKNFSRIRDATPKNTILILVTLRI